MKNLCKKIVEPLENQKALSKAFFDITSSLGKMNNFFISL